MMPYCILCDTGDLLCNIVGSVDIISNVCVRFIKFTLLQYFMKIRKSVPCKREMHAFASCFAPRL